MIRDAVTAGLLSQQPLVTRVTAVIEADTDTSMGALEDDDKALAKLYKPCSGRGVAANNRRIQRAHSHEPDSIRDRTQHLLVTRE